MHANGRSLAYTTREPEYIRRLLGESVNLTRSRLKLDAAQALFFAIEQAGLVVFEPHTPHLQAPTRPVVHHMVPATDNPETAPACFIARRGTRHSTHRFRTSDIDAALEKLADHDWRSINHLGHHPNWASHTGFIRPDSYGSGPLLHLVPAR